MTRQYRRWMTTELRRAAKMRADGMSYQAIGDVLGRDDSVVRSALHRYGADTHVPQSHETPEYLGWMRRAFVLRNQRQSYARIAAEIGWPVTPSALRKALILYAAREGMPLYSGLPKAAVA